jgi:hypothetical protein
MKPEVKPVVTPVLNPVLTPVTDAEPKTKAEAKEKPAITKTIEQLSAKQAPLL